MDTILMKYTQECSTFYSDYDLSVTAMYSIFSAPADRIYIPLLVC